MQDKYVDAVIDELNFRRDYISASEVNTIYMGGGTPSTLSRDNIKKLAKTLYDYTGSHRQIDEFTMECNPDDVTEALVSTIKESGINRISMGAQTFSDERLKILNRRHNARQVKEAVKLLRINGVENISIDLMFGFPNETIDDWKQDIEEALNLNVEHISAYSLMYEEGTLLYQKLEKGLIKETDEVVSLSMYELLTDELAGSGYEHYEISNFAKKGYRSRHNSSYWQGTPYLGLGAAAHSYDKESRQWNINDVAEYIYIIQKARSEGYETIMDSIIEREILSETEKYNDIVTTALRTREGIDLRILSDTQRDYILKSTRNAVTNNLLTLQDDHLRLTRKGLFVSDSVMEEAIMLD